MESGSVMSGPDLSSPTTRLDVELVRRGLARSRPQASTLLSNGRVQVEGAVVTKASTKVSQASEISVIEDLDDPDFVSRGGHKLAGALADFAPLGLQVSERRCLDAGASTGGFTDVLLRAGATTVVAVDVGTEQLVSSLRDDPRVGVHEQTSLRGLRPDQVGGQVDVAVADLSFISLVKVLPELAALTLETGDMVLMVKPQFEVGKSRLGRGGVVSDPALRLSAVEGVIEAAEALGWGCRAVTTSQLPGPSGNVEFFVWLAQGAGTCAAETIARVVTSAQRLGELDESVGL